MFRPAASLPPETHTQKGYNPRVLLFHGLIAALLLTLIGGLAWQQLLRTDYYHAHERTQSERRILVPGPRGNIFDREGRLLAGNRPRFGVTLALDQLHAEFRQEYLTIRKNYGNKDLPTTAQMEQIARFTVVQGYLKQLNDLLARNEQLDGDALDRHYDQQLLLPYVLLNDLTPEEYARLIEQLPVDSPLQVYASSVRYYPRGSLAAHALGYVTAGDEPAGTPEDFPGDGLTTFKLKGTVGRLGLEARFDDRLQGETGGAIYRVSPAGYRLNPPLEKYPPVAGHDLTTSLDADLQSAAEDALGEQTGAAVALDVNTGEVLVLASTPGYNLQDFTPKLGNAAAEDINARGAWFDRAVNGLYPPGSTFKLVTTIAALRSGAITPDVPIVDCEGTLAISGHVFTCDNGLGHHGNILLRDAIALSCDIYFYTAGTLTTVDKLAPEARRFQLDQPTGIELPGETRRAIIPDGQWKETHQHQAWYPGDTANMSIGQGYVRVTPLRMACLAASIARNEIATTPTLLHNPNAPVQHHEAIGLTPDQRAALLDGMEGCTTTGTAKILSADEGAFTKIPNLRIAGKTGTAQIPDKKNIAWFICFAPLESPRIAVAVAVESDKPGESFAGGAYAAPVAQAILRRWNDKQLGRAAAAPPLFPPASAAPTAP
jgi:penicillin-binding protein 2